MASVDNFKDHLPESIAEFIERDCANFVRSIESLTIFDEVAIREAVGNTNYQHLMEMFKQFRLAREEAMHLLAQESRLAKNKAEGQEEER